MKLIKLQLFLILSLLISINIYADHLFYASKCDIDNESNYINNLGNNNLYHQFYQEPITTNCENIKLTDPTKYIYCKLNNNKAIALPALPFIAEGVKDALIAAGTALGAGALLNENTKEPWNLVILL